MKDVTLADINDYVEDLKSKGLDDESKLQGMIKRANEIAKKDGKHKDQGEYKEDVLGIFQGFMNESNTYVSRLFIESLL